MLALIGLFAAALGCLSLYLASPRQLWLAKPLPTWPACLAGIAMTGLGWFGLAQDMRPLTATFTWITALMLVFAALPYVAALRGERRGR